jgi:hypothetical protein
VTAQLQAAQAMVTEAREQTAAAQREGAERLSQAEREHAGALRAQESSAAVSRPGACIGSPCLRHCGHGASIGGGRGGEAAAGGAGGAAAAVRTAAPDADADACAS